jgi:PAS domain S-box-containing protein
MNRVGKTYISTLHFLSWIMALCIVVFPVAVSFANAADAGRAKRVLMLFSGSQFAPGSALVEQSVQQVLQKGPQPVDFYAEYLDANRLPSESHYQLFRKYLQEKYAHNPPDVIVTFLILNFELAGRLPAELFPGIPMVLGALTEEEVPREGFGNHVTGVVQRIDFAGALELILKLQPETERIIVIGGTAPLDHRYLTRTKEAARLLAGRVQFDYWTTLPVAEMRQAVASLPPRTVIFFTTLFRDATGKNFLPASIAPMLAVSSSVPVYVVADSLIGGGTVGGLVAHLEALGRRLGELAQQVLGGTAPAALPTEVRKDGVPMFDWRALKRWGISESRLPPDSVVRFRPLSMWEEYRRTITGALVIIAIQALLIAGLLLQRARRLRAEAELRESKEFMELSTSAGDLGLWVRDLERGDLWANQRLRSLFGFGQNDVLRFDDVLARIHPEDRSQVDSLVQHAQEHGLPFEADFRVLSDGTERWIAAKGQSLGNAPGRAMRRMGALIDITTRKKAELEEQRHRDELAHVSRVSMMGQLASALAHELNQPLGAILRNAEAAELFVQASPPDLQEVRAILADIRKDDQRAGEVIDRMRALLKRRESQWSELDLNAVAEEVAGLLRFDAEARRVKLTLELSRSVSGVRGDRVQLQQVLLNLILNAMDAMNECEAGRRCVEIGVRPREGEVEVAVSDSGHGILAANVKRLFEPFFTTKPSGMGLGLAISHTIIQAHGGRLWAENNPDGGATFRFTLPVAGSVEGRGSSDGGRNILL